MRIRIRKEKNEYLVYFIDSRRIIGVNEIGSLILKLLFNEEKTVEEIADIISHDYKISLEQAMSDTVEFLDQMENEIQPNEFNVIEQKQLEAPLGVELEITTSCNLRCRHCFQGHHSEVYMETNKAIEIIGKLVDSGVCEISLIGGEPLVHPGLMDILEYCQDRDMAINLITNATLIDEHMLKRLAEIKRLVVIVSLDGMRDVHDYIRGKGVFDKVDIVLKLLLDYSIPVETTFTLNSINIGIYRDVIEYCEKLKIPCNFNIFKPFRPEHEKLILDPESFFEVVCDLFKLRKDKGYKIGLSNAAIVTELLGVTPRDECRATRSGIVIDVYGRMITCPSLSEAGYYKDNEIPFFDENFLKTWRNHESFVNFRKNGLRECQARSLIFSKDVRGVDPYGIDAFKEYLRKKENVIVEV